jgi:DNA-binding NarL/FixJ family response regulator
VSGAAPPAPTAEIRAAVLGQLLGTYTSLRACATVGELLAVASAEACTTCGFTRALVLSLRGDHLSADGSDPLRDPSSDVLRRSVLAAPVPLRGWNQESVLLRPPDAKRDRRTAATRSVVAEALGLEHYALGAIAPEGTAVALLVVDRRDEPVDDAARSDVAGFAGVIGVALEQAVLRARMQEMAAEVRFLSGSALGVVDELAGAPVAIPVHGRRGPVFSGADDPFGGVDGVTLSAREHEVAQLMARGRSNREIAELLHLSPDTIKGNVADVLRKLRAANRAEAVAKYVRAGQR